MVDKKDGGKDDEKAPIPKKSRKKVSITKKLKQNPWILSTLVFAIIIILFMLNLFGSSSGKVSGETVGQNFVNFINLKGGVNLEYVSVNDFGPNLYEVIVLSEGNQVPVYITKDGKYFVQILSPLTETENQPSTPSSQNSNSQEITKADVPKAELFIWSYCPYGVTALAPFAEVAKLFGDKVDFKVVLYYDGHGEHETQQNKIQECIQKYEKDKYWDYAIGFAEDIYSECGSTRDVACNLDKSTELMNSLGIDSTAILSCVESEGTDLFQAASARAKELGVTGSPSFVLNDILLNLARDAESYKDAACQSFNDVPEECGTELSSNQATTSGNC